MDLGFHGRVEKILKIKFVQAEDIINYKEPSMVIGFPKCSFKCDHECGVPVCQNSNLANMPDIEVPNERIVNYYLSNPITKAIVFAGLEPFDSPEDLLDLVNDFRKKTDDFIIIYTGYTEKELIEDWDSKGEVYYNLLENCKNIIIKYGRFIPNRPHEYDEVLGVELSSDNQYARRIN